MKLKADTLTAKKDSTLLIKEKNPKKAALFSAILPGAGQIYNRKYWKPPIIWGLGVALVLSYQFNDREFKTGKSALLAKTDGDPTTIDPFPTLAEQAVLNNTQLYQRRRDFSAAGMVLLYALNIVDAMVDAHLSKFDVSENLSLIPFQQNQFLTSQHIQHYQMALIFNF